jgi:hypothetical protein
MGNALPSISTRCLPQPRHDRDVKQLAEWGVTYVKQADRCMWRVELDATKVRLLLEEQWREDMQEAKLLNMDNQELASINWMSKGAYDNKASITCFDTPTPLTLKTTEFLVPHPTMTNAFVVETRLQDPDRIKEDAFVEAINAMYEAHARGQHQTQLDGLHTTLTEMQTMGETKGWLPPGIVKEFYAFDKLQEQSGSERMHAALLAANNALVWRTFALREVTKEEPKSGSASTKK